MDKTSYRSIFLFITVLIPVLINSKPAAAQHSTNDTLVAERLSAIQTMISRDILSDNRWWYGWLGAYSGATIAQTSVWIAVDDLSTRQDMALGAATTLIGAAGQMISPLKPNREWQRIRQLPERTGEERRIKLMEAERLLQQTALNEKIGRSFKTHAISMAVNLGSGLVTWLGFKRSVWAGLGNFALNTAITETQIFTQPKRAMKDYDNYVKKYKDSPVPSSPVSISLNVYPGGISLLMRF